MGNFFIIYTRQRSPLTPCDIIVASAAPDTPSLKTMINVRSSIIFKILEKTRMVFYCHRQLLTVLIRDYIKL